MDAGNGAFGYHGAVPWGMLTPEQRLQFARSQPGSGIALTEMAQENAQHPGRGQSNYWDKLMGAVAGNSTRLPHAYVPGSMSGIGMMSGDAGQDIANASRQTVQNYGADPRNDYIPPAALSDPNSAAAVMGKQRAREQEWLGHQGEALGQVTGTADSYVPGAGRESREVLSYGQDSPSASERIRQQILRWQRMRAAGGGQ